MRITKISYCLDEPNYDLTKEKLVEDHGNLIKYNFLLIAIKKGQMGTTLGLFYTIGV